MEHAECTMSRSLIERPRESEAICGTKKSKMHTSEYWEENTLPPHAAGVLFNNQSLYVWSKKTFAIQEDMMETLAIQTSMYTP